MATKKERELTPKELAELKKTIGNEKWRLSHLYYITNEKGKKVLFKMNWAQKSFYRTMWYLSIILKARQLGFTTFIQIFILDRVIWNNNIRAGVIAHNKDDAQVFFRDKIKFAYDNIPDKYRDLIPKAVKNDAGELLLSNNSSVRVGTSLRSGTLQYLHVSEFGKICAKYPEKAREIVTGAFNAVHEGHFIFIESTAEGREGKFFDMTEIARNLLKMGKKLSKLDFKFFFFPWWKHPSYRTDPDNIIITDEDEKYFDELESKSGITVDAEQKAWYVKKLEGQGEDMKREYPSTPDEAFEQSIVGAYYSRQMAWIRKNNHILNIPFDPRLKVYTFFDLGRNDFNVIWFMQHVGMEYRFIHYYENCGESIQFYAKYMLQLDYVYGTVYFPHDGEVVELTREDNKSRKEIMEGFGFKVVCVPRVPDKREAHQAVRDALPQCYFDERGCALGIKHLDHYRRQWNDKIGAFQETPLHNDASHGNDGFEQFARGFTPERASKVRRRAKNWRTA